jgi:hypothetical protein
VEAEPVELAVVAPDARRVGLQPARQIDRSNVSRLRMVWARGMGTGTVEATPLVMTA